MTTETYDPFDLQRFVSRQSADYHNALEELRAGEKRSHWMWYVFPQIRGLGRTPMAEYFAITTLEEAEAYAAHPVLGPRLRDCTGAVNAHPDKTANEIFGSPDDLKFRSSMTLFEAATGEAATGEAIFKEALDRFYDGERDPLTLERL